MKRFILIGVVLTAFLACSKDTVLDVNKGAAIEFAVAAQTRAQEVTTSNLETFYVTAVDPQQNNNYYTDLQYTKSGQYFQSNPTYYWPGNADHTLDIYAYAPSAEGLKASVEINNGVQKLNDFSPAEDISEQQDFITAVLQQQGRPGNASPVQLTFQHRLAQIEIKALNKNTVRDYWVEGVRLGQIKSNGDFNFRTSEWTLDDDKKTYEVTYDDAVKLSPVASSLMMSEGDNAMILPQTFTTEWDPIQDPKDLSEDAYISVKVKSAPVSGNEYIEPEDSKWVALPIPAGTVWEAGRKYIYILDFSVGSGYPDPTSPEAGVEVPDFGNVIHFSVTFDEWDISEPTDPEAHPLVGEWELAGASVSLTITDEQGNVSDFQSAELNSKVDVIDGLNMPEAEFLTFITYNTVSLYTQSELLYVEEDSDGSLFVPFAEGQIKAKIECLSNTTMDVSFGIFYIYEEEENIDEGVEGDVENQAGYFQITLHYNKVEKITDHYERPDEYNQWEECLVGKWKITGYIHTFTYYDDNENPITEEIVNCSTHEEIVEMCEGSDDIDIEPFYFINFYSLMLWSDYSGGYHFTSFRNNRFVAISAYDDSIIIYLNDITQDSFNVTFSYTESLIVGEDTMLDGVCDVVFYYSKINSILR